MGPGALRRERQVGAHWEDSSLEEGNTKPIRAMVDGGPA